MAVLTLLFLCDTELTAKEIQDAFSLSKGGVSQLLKDLEEWRVLKDEDARKALWFSPGYKPFRNDCLAFSKTRTHGA